MLLDYVPLLERYRELYRIPRGRERFQAYIDLTVDPTPPRPRPRFPTVAMNPMAREHVLTFIEELIAIDADTIGGSTVAQLAPAFLDLEGQFKVGLVVLDPRGGWTSRAAVDHAIRFGGAMPKGFDWICGHLWADGTPMAIQVQQSIAEALWRHAYVAQHGQATTLREKLAQEGAVLAAAGCNEPRLDDDDLEYTRKVIEPYLESNDLRESIECLFGDAAARSLGFTPRGLSPDAGLALALHNARESASWPLIHGR